jgi:hypothetical protein
MEPFSAFADDRQIAAGNLEDVALACKRCRDAEPHASIFLFDNDTSSIVEVDLRGDEAAVREWLNAHHPGTVAPKARGRGRPKLGVTSREVTLLPRHWDWLRQQPGGASVTLRRLVETARKDEATTARHAQDLTYRFAVVMAGDCPGFEEAIRALYAKDKTAFDAATEPWPDDIRRHAAQLAGRVWLP